VTSKKKWREYLINNNNQTFYSQASWGRLQMKPHESKNQGQNRAKKEGGKQWAIIEEGEKAINCENGQEKNLTKRQ
jgi:hypothetical protein